MSCCIAACQASLLLLTPCALTHGCPPQGTRAQGLLRSARELLLFVQLYACKALVGHVDQLAFAQRMLNMLHTTTEQLAEVRARNVGSPLAAAA